MTIRQGLPYWVPSLVGAGLPDAGVVALGLDRKLEKLGAST